MIKRVPTLDVQTRLPLAAGAVMLWVAVGPWAWGFAGSRSAVADHVSLVLALGPLSLLIAALRPAAFVTLVGRVWLVLSPWLLGYPTGHVAWVDELVTGLLLIALCLKATGADRAALVKRRRPGRSSSRPSRAGGRVASSS